MLWQNIFVKITITTNFLLCLHVVPPAPRNSIRRGLWLCLPGQIIIFSHNTLHNLKQRWHVLTVVSEVQATITNYFTPQNSKEVRDMVFMRHIYKNPMIACSALPSNTSVMFAKLELTWSVLNTPSSMVTLTLAQCNPTDTLSEDKHFSDWRESLNLHV